MHPCMHTNSISSVAARGLLYTYTRADALGFSPRAGCLAGGGLEDEVAIGCAVGVCLSVLVVL